MKRAESRSCVLIAVFAAVLAAGSGCGRRNEERSPSAEGTQDHSEKSSSSISRPFASLSFDEALVRARAEKKLVFIDLYADWCGWCTRMDEDVFADERVQSALLGYIPIKVDADRGGRSVASRYRVSGLPTFLLVNGEGELVGRFDGYMPVDTFLDKLGRSSGARG